MTEKKNLLPAGFFIAKPLMFYQKEPMKFPRGSDPVYLREE